MSEELVSTVDLDGLRAKIDALDLQMHEALMARSVVIDMLIKVKKTNQSGAAFRPGREARMMRRLMARHQGNLPDYTIEHIWREIISTFTCMQAPFQVHVARPRDHFALYDAARYQFGFTVPVCAQGEIADVVLAVEQSSGDLGVLPVGNLTQAWWSLLLADDAPKIIARLPFVIRDNHPAPAPCLLISRPIDEKDGFEYSVYAVSHPSKYGITVQDHSEAYEVLAHVPFDDELGQNYLISFPYNIPHEEILHLLQVSDAPQASIVCIGGYAAPHLIR